MWMGIGVAAVSLLIGAKVFSRQFDGLYKASCVALLLLITGTGHFGGSLTHGSDYLTAALHSGEENIEASVIKPIATIQEANIYADVVQPILQTKCYSCHGEQKQKGKLRMDTPQFLLKGGKGGEIIVPGKGDESELIRRALLPEGDKKHMPPKEKPQLTQKQVALLHWWIQEGASFDKKVKDLPQNERLKPILAALQKGEPKEKEKVAMIPQTEVEAANTKYIQALKDKGIVVLPVAQNSNYLMVNFVTATNITDKDLQLLVPLKKQLLWLKLNDAIIGDSALLSIGHCTNLRVLQLAHTLITDKGLAQLKSLTELTTLSLVGTGVTGAGLLTLKDLPKLSAVYLFKTKLEKRNWIDLKKAFPKTMLDTGGYTVPTLATDTTVVEYQVKKT